MEGLKTGITLVINNIKFENKNVDEKLEERKGADVDKENLRELFTQMGFEIDYVENQTERQIKNKIKEFTDYSNKILKDVDSCFVIIMSHGRQGVGLEDTLIYTSDNKLIKANDTVSRFSSSCCKLLQGKPKFIIFQACRGDLTDLALIEQSSEININYQKITVTKASSSIYSRTTESDNSATKSSIIEQNNKLTNTKTIPSMSDIFIYYTTRPGFISYRDPEKGAWLIQCFCEVFMNHVYNTDVSALFSMVTNRVLERRTNGQALQIPQRSIYGKFQPCFLYPSLKSIDDYQETKIDGKLLNLAKEFEQETEITEIKDNLKKFI